MACSQLLAMAQEQAGSDWRQRWRDLQGGAWRKGARLRRGREQERQSGGKMEIIMRMTRMASNAIMEWLDVEEQVKPIDVAYVFAIAALFPMLRVFMDLTIFSYLGRVLLIGGKKAIKQLPDKDKKKLDKFKESAWKLCIYSFFTFGLLFALRKERWLYDAADMWRGLPHKQSFKRQVKLMYLFELAFYNYCVPALLVWETKRKDFRMMMTHHVVTIILIGLSYTFSYARVGTAIMILHDACDIFLEAAKMCKYCKNEIGANVFFVTFTLSWLLLRLIYYPFFCIRSAIWVSIEVMGKPPEYHTIFIICLCSLQVMHVFWFYMIVKMIFKALGAGGVQEDYRSDDEDDD